MLGANPKLWAGLAIALLLFLSTTVSGQTQRDGDIIVIPTPGQRVEIPVEIQKCIARGQFLSYMITTRKAGVTLEDSVVTQRVSEQIMEYMGQPISAETQEFAVRILETVYGLSEEDFANEEILQELGNTEVQGCIDALEAPKKPDRPA